MFPAKSNYIAQFIKFYLMIDPFPLTNILLPRTYFVPVRKKNLYSLYCVIGVKQRNLIENVL